MLYVICNEVKNWHKRKCLINHVIFVIQSFLWAYRSPLHPDQPID